MFLRLFGSRWLRWSGGTASGKTSRQALPATRSCLLDAKNSSTGVIEGISCVGKAFGQPHQKPWLPAILTRSQSF